MSKAPIPRTLKVARGLIQYNTEADPTAVGVYACRVPTVPTLDLLEDKFLLWHDDKWWHLLSAQRYRGEVSGWIGPLSRRLK